MASTQEKWQEIADRGIQDKFDPDTRAKFDEAVNRGLITLPKEVLSTSQSNEGSDIINSVAGVVEPISAVMQGIIAEPASGIAGLGALASDTLGITNGTPESRASFVDQIRSDLSYKPQTQQGAKNLESLSKSIGGAVEGARDFAGGYLPEGQFKEEFEEEGLGPALGSAALDAGAGPEAAAVLSGLPSAVIEAIGFKGAGRVGKIDAGLPSEGIKKIFRGGEDGRQAVSETVEAFETATGQAPTLGQATGRQTLQAIESGVGKFAGGRPLRSQLDKISEGAKQKVQSIADQISGVKGVEEAGRVIQKGIVGGDGFIERFKGKSADLWGRVDEFIPSEKQVDVSNTKNTLGDSVSGGLFGRVLDDPKLVEINNILQEAGDSVDYGTLKLLRSQIGRKLGSNELISDIPRAELKRLYGAISEDIRTAAGKSDPSALKAYDRANNFTRSGHGRIDDFIDRVAKKVDLDKIFNAVTKGGEGSQVINSFKRSLKPEEWDVVASNVIRRMGKSTAGRQDALGDAFSLDKFLTDYNKLGPAKKALFSGTKNLNKYSDDLDQIARVAERAKEASSELAGSSGTAQLASAVGIGSGVTASLLSGNLGLAASLVGLVGVNRGAATLMASPKFVNWLAKSSKGKNMDAAKSIGRLGIIAESANDAEARAIEEYIESVKELITD